MYAGPSVTGRRIEESISRGFRFSGGPLRPVPVVLSLPSPPTTGSLLPRTVQGLLVEEKLTPLLLGEIRIVTHQLHFILNIYGRTLVLFVEPVK